MNRVKNEHFVPQFYLKRFANKRSEKNHQISVYDKISQKSFLANVRDVAAEGKYFDIPLMDGLEEEQLLELKNINDNQLIEKFFAQSIEGPYKQFIDRIITRFTVTKNPALQKAITIEEKIPLSILIAIQMLRTKKFRNIAGEIGNKLSQSLVDKIAKENFPDYKPYDIKIKVPDENTKLLHASMILSPSDVTEFAQTLCEHIWVVGINKTNLLFYTSDNPIVKYVHKKDGTFSGGGIASSGIELDFPLNPSLILMMFDRKHHFRVQELENLFIEIDNIKNIEFYNSLQVLQSDRQFFSKDGNFDLVKKMKNVTPNLFKKGPLVDLYHGGIKY